MGFEKERALLITRATVAEAQVSDLQDYIDNHLGRSGSHFMCKSYNVNFQRGVTLSFTTYLQV